LIKGIDALFELALAFALAKYAFNSTKL